MFDDVSALPSGVDEDAAFLIPGARLGKYQLIRRLAIGGMAEIHLARALGIEGFEKLVVLKRILPQYARSADYVQMFLDEARLAASLDHANIVQVHDIGRVGKSTFFTMEYLRGQDVRHVLVACKRAARGLSLAEALSIVIPVAAGLHYAHERRRPDGGVLGIVHRDVSPANVIVTHDGNVKVVDFGIAKSNLRNAQTRAGTLKGKIAYMSPEQCRGAAIDHRSDVFSLGIMLYELTVGARPHEGDNEFAILSQIVGHDAIPPSQRKPGFPAELERILLKALSRDVDARYATAQAMQRDLEHFARSERLEIGSLTLQRLLAELQFRHLTEPRIPAPVEGPDDEVSYSVVVEAAGDGELELEGPAAQLDDEVLALGSRPGSDPRQLLPEDAASFGASALSEGVVVRRGRGWLVAVFGAAILAVGIGLGVGLAGRHFMTPDEPAVAPPPVTEAQGQTPATERSAPAPIESLPAPAAPIVPAAPPPSALAAVPSPPPEAGAGDSDPEPAAPPPSAPNTPSLPDTLDPRPAKPPPAAASEREKPSKSRGKKGKLAPKSAPTRTWDPDSALPPE